MSARWLALRPDRSTTNTLRHKFINFGPGPLVHVVISQYEKNVLEPREQIIAGLHNVQGGVTYFDGPEAEEILRYLDTVAAHLPSVAAAPEPAAD